MWLLFWRAPSSSPSCLETAVCYAHIHAAKDRLGVVMNVEL